MTEYYEAHITFHGPKQEDMQGWTHSEIAGDITYGAGRKQYLTRHFNKRKNVEDITVEMEFLSIALRANACEVLRNKVELVVYDQRFK